MRKILAVVLIISMSLSILALAVSAEALTEKDHIQSMVVFGDSISTGYGLEGTIYTRTSYANLVASALGLSCGNGYVNYAVDGDTSADIFRMVKQYPSAVKEADLIILTCGGNDILKHALTIAISTSGSTSSNLIQVALSLLSKPEDEVKAALYSEKNEAVIENALSVYQSNMTDLVAHLRAQAPNARIIFLTQYNPLSGIPVGTVLDLYAENVIGRLNNIMQETVLAGGCEIVDTHAVMTKRGMELSNIMASDIHPNAAGHAAMAEMVKNYLGIEEPEISEMTTTLPAMTTTVPSTVMTTGSETVTEPVTVTTQPPVTVTETTTAPAVTTATVSYTTTVALAVTTTDVTETTTTVAENTGVTAVSSDGTQVTMPEETEILEESPKSSGTSPLVMIIGAVLLFVGVAGTVFAIVVRKK